MEILWAPWRMEYILSDKPEGCIFCKCLSSSDHKQNFLLYFSQHCFVVLNRFPYNNGHLMVVPNRHISEIEELTSEELSDLMQTIKLCVIVLKKALFPHGFNIGANLGKTAGAGIVDHLHFHIVPRWEGDTNYMPVIGNTKVMPEVLEKTYEKLLPFFKGGEDKRL
jgi:ATP adenylyltransferase